MKKNKIKGGLSGAILACCLLMVTLAGCKKEPIVFQTSDQLNITGYLDNNPDMFSEWRKILDITGNAGFLQAYGNYTHFVPTNDAVKLYLKDLGKTSSDQVDLQTLKNVVRFHLLEDTIATQKFSDGKLQTLTMLGQYLITGVKSVNGISKIDINRQALLVQGNIRVGNGIIHVIDHVLQPAKLTLAQMIEANPSKFSIFTDALKLTGMYDVLNLLPVNNPDPKRKFLTVLVESDDVLKSAGITSLAQLLSTYSPNATNYTASTNGLHRFIEYHILYDAKYLADIVSFSSHSTLASPEIVKATLEGDKVLINDIPDFNGTYEPGFLLDRATSDNSAANGVLHVTAPYVPANAPATTGHFDIKVRVPFPVYWDVADFPEIRKQTTYFRKKSAPAFAKASATTTPIAGWNWQNNNAAVTYTTGTTYVFGDYLVLTLGLSNRNDWMEMKTPLIVAGKYRVWACWRRQVASGSFPTGSRCQCRTLIDGIPLAKPFDFTETIASGSVAERESLGWKNYTSPKNDSWIGKDLGVIDIPNTDVHTLRLEVILGTQPTNNLDMFHFIPVKPGQSQILPRFRQDGSADFTP